MKLRDVWQDYDLVFCRADGSPWHPKTVSTRFVDTAERLGMPHLSLHGLRHTWATLALGGNVHPRVVQERLGHSSVGVTLDIYSHVTPAMQSLAAEQVAALIYGDVQ
jgi:integrase